MDLKVKIRKKYKEGLVKKWTWRRRADYNGWLDCPLCDSFHNIGGHFRCNGCPFNKFRAFLKMGCIVWINKIDPLLSLNNPDEERFNKFIKKARKLITFY